MTQEVEREWMTVKTFFAVEDNVLGAPGEFFRTDQSSNPLDVQIAEYMQKYSAVPVSAGPVTVGVLKLSDNRAVLAVTAMVIFRKGVVQDGTIKKNNSKSVAGANSTIQSVELIANSLAASLRSQSVGQPIPRHRPGVHPGVSPVSIAPDFADRVGAGEQPAGTTGEPARPGAGSVPVADTIADADQVGEILRDILR